MKIYTKTGDSGTTGLYRGGRVSKAHPLIRAIGTIDELNGWLGVVRAGVDSTTLGAVFARVQHQLFDVGADLASQQVTDCSQATLAHSTKVDEEAYVGRLKMEQVHWLEATIDGCEQTLPELRQFILPGGSLAASHCHLARAVCRRAERDVVASREHIANAAALDLVQVYLNRLADLLFMLARQINLEQQVAETVWEPDAASPRDDV